MFIINGGGVMGSHSKRCSCYVFIVAHGSLSPVKMEIRLKTPCWVIKIQKLAVGHFFIHFLVIEKHARVMGHLHASWGSQ